MTYTQEVPIDIDGTEVIATVRYSWTPGRPAFTPRGEYAPIDPPEPPEVDILDVTVAGEKVPEWFSRAVRDSDNAYNWMADRHDEFAQ